MESIDRFGKTRKCVRDKQLVFEGLDNAETIGLELRAARLKHGLSLQDVAKKLNISMHYLSKLEAGQFSGLPGSAYATGFLRSYANLVDLDAECLVATYNGLSDRAESPNFDKMPMTARPSQRSAPAIASMIVVLSGIVYGGWYIMNDAHSIDQSDAETVVGTPPLSSPSMSQRLVNSKTEDVKLAVADFEQRLEKAPVLVSAPQTQELTSVLIQDVKNFALPKSNPNRLTADKNLAQRLAPVTPDVREPQTVSKPENPSLQTNAAIATLRDPAKEIVISAVAASWVEIIRSDGEKVITKLMRPGESYVVDSGSQLYLSTGNAGGLMVVVGGDQPRSMGKVGEIIRDMPLVSHKLRKMF
jgi:cytoskeleton protein RodZ